MTLKDEYLRNADGKVSIAAVRFAEDLMAGEPREMRAGYSEENAIIAAIEIFGAEAFARDALRSMISVRRTA